MPTPPDFDTCDAPCDRRDGAGEGGGRLRAGREVGGAVQEQHVAAFELGDRLAGREPGRETDHGADLRVTGGAERGPSAHRMADEDDRQVAVGLQQLVERPFRVAHRIGIGRVPAAVAVPEQGDGRVGRSPVHGRANGRIRT